MLGLSIWLAMLPAVLGEDALTPGNHQRAIEFGGQARPYLVHVPKGYDPATPTPVVLALHSFATPAFLMPGFTGLNDTSERAGFVVVYPQGTGTPVRWNSGGFRGQTGDDVGYIRSVIDDLSQVANVDPQRIYATGMSNGGMMCYRLAAELSDRIAAIAPVAGTMAQPTASPVRPVSVIHFHGTADTLVPFDGPRPNSPAEMTFKSVTESVQTWAALDGCPAEPQKVTLADIDPADDCTV